MQHSSWKNSMLIRWDTLRFTSFSSSSSSLPSSNVFHVGWNQSAMSFDVQQSTCGWGQLEELRSVQFFLTVSFDCSWLQLSQLKALMRGSVAALNKEAIIQYTQILIPQKTKNRIQRFMDKSRLFLMENWKRLWIIVLWLGAMAGLFTWKFLQYRHKNAFIVMGYCVCVAKGSIETVKLNMALILLPVCRNTLTWLRSTKLGSFIPFDDNLEFHKASMSTFSMILLW